MAIGPQAPALRLHHEFIPTCSEPYNSGFLRFLCLRCHKCFHPRQDREVTAPRGVDFLQPQQTPVTPSFLLAPFCLLDPEQHFSSQIEEGRMRVTRPGKIKIPKTQGTYFVCSDMSTGAHLGARLLQAGSGGRERRQASRVSRVCGKHLALPYTLPSPHLFGSQTTLGLDITSYALQESSERERCWPRPHSRSWLRTDQG